MKKERKEERKKTMWKEIKKNRRKERKQSEREEKRKGIWGSINGKILPTIFFCHTIHRYIKDLQ